MEISLSVFPIPVSEIDFIRVEALDVSTLDVDRLLLSDALPLSAERIGKCRKYHFKQDRQLSLGAGLLLDKMLQHYGLREKDMTYVYGPMEKPAFATHPELHFNLSHSIRYAVCAVSAEVEVGIDIEKNILYNDDVASICMDEAERRILQSLSVQEQATAFTASWCVKEAILKVNGTGLDETLFPKLNFRKESSILADERYADLSIQRFSLPGYQGALAWKQVQKEN